MTDKKGNTTHLRDTISALDSAVDQWNSITNNPETAQAPDSTDLQKKTKDLLNTLRDQLDEFSSTDKPEPSTEDTSLPAH